MQKYDLASRLLTFSISITYMLQSTLMLHNCFKILCKIWACIRIANWPNIYYLHVAVNFDATKFLQNFVQKYEPVSRLLIDPISIYLCCSQLWCYTIASKFCANYEPVSGLLIGPISITYMLQSTLMLQNSFKILCKNMSLYQDC